MGRQSDSSGASSCTAAAERGRHDCSCAEAGTINEGGALIHGPAGLCLVEIKGRPGEISGDSGDTHTWTWRNDGRLYTDDNPLFTA